MMFLGTGMIGIAVGLQITHFMFVTMGTVNLCLGGFFGYLFFTQKPKPRDKRKKKKED